MNKTAHNEYGSIDQIALRHADKAFVDKQTIANQFQQLNYYSCPDFENAVKEYNNFFDIISNQTENIALLPSDDKLTIDSIYVRDSLITTDHGLILCKMGKDERKSEPNVNADFLKESGIDILGEITGSGKIEGGDFIWIDKKTAAIGLGYRTNAEGIRQFKDLTKDFVDEVITVHLPHYKGENDVFHLMSIISPLDSDLAAVYSPLMPVAFRQELLSRGIKFVEIPDGEFESMGCNILTLAPRKCLMLSGNPITKQRLMECGVEVIEYDGEDISKKGAGGPTCLTRPLLRTV